MSESEEGFPASTILIGGVFLIGLLKLYRNMHGKKGGSSSGKSQGGGSRFGGGGMSDYLNMGKSGAQVFGVDKKIKTRFKHVAGLTNAKTEVLEFVDFLK